MTTEMVITRDDWRSFMRVLIGELPELDDTERADMLTKLDARDPYRMSDVEHFRLRAHAWLSPGWVTFAADEERT